MSAGMSEELAELGYGPEGVAAALALRAAFCATCVGGVLEGGLFFFCKVIFSCTTK